MFVGSRALTYLMMYPSTADVFILVFHKYIFKESSPAGYHASQFRLQARLSIIQAVEFVSDYQHVRLLNVQRSTDGSSTPRSIQSLWGCSTLRSL